MVTLTLVCTPTVFPVWKYVCVTTSYCLTFGGVLHSVPTWPSVSNDNINSGKNCRKLWQNSSASPIAQAEWLSGAQAAGEYKYIMYSF